ncbi:hypothetical protein ACFL4W_01635 [Planctomycetota bacterium]
MLEDVIPRDKTLCVSVAFMLILLSLGCAFTSRVIDRTGFDSVEMMYDNLLPDRDLPDITAGIVSQGGGGSGGGAVGGCWSCG